MATVTKDFRIKSGLVVEGANATVNGSDLITEDAITGGTQTNITVTYNPATKTVDFVAENGVADSTTDDLIEGDNNLYFTEQRVEDAVTNNMLGQVTAGHFPVTKDPASGNLAVVAPTTDSISEGNTNLYYTDQRARNAISAAQGAPVTYNGNIGEIDFTLGPTSGLEIDPSNNGLSLPDAATNVGTFGSTTQIPSITVDDKGRVTAVTTNDVATNLSIAGDTGTDTVDLLNDTLTVTGTNGISAAVADNTITVTSNATDDVIPGTIVSRDLDGNFLGNKITATQGLETVGTSGYVKSHSYQGIDVGEGTTQFSMAADFITIGYSSGSSINFASNKLTGVAEPTQPQDAATKNYVDSAVSGLDWKEAVNLFADSNVALTGATETLVIDGHAALDATDNGVYRILLTAQTVDAENGIYTYTDDGSNYTLVRSSDADTYQELDGAAVFVQEGTQYGSTSWVQSNHYMTDFTGQSWSQFSGQGTYTAGYGLTLTGNTFAVNDAEIVNQTELGLAVQDLTEYVDGFLNSNDGTTIQYIDDQDDATLLSANQYTDTAIQTGDATATPTYLALDINSVAKQVAASATTDGAGTDYVVYEFLCSNEYGNTEYYRSAKFLVKMASGTHTQVSEILLTLDSSNNLAITEYAIVGTNGNLGNVSASVFGAQSSFPDKIQLTVNSASVLNVKVAGTLLV